MAQRTSGFHFPLRFPSFYSPLQSLLGKDSLLRLVTEDIRPHSGMRIVDIGCGPGTIIEFLPADVHYHGVDVNRRYIEAARRRYGSRATFEVLDAGEEGALRQLSACDCALAIGVLHHLSDGEASRLIESLDEVLAPGGRLLAMDPCFAEGQSPIARFLMSQDRGRYVRTETQYRRLASGAFSAVESRLEHDRCRIPWTHVIMECRRS